MFFFKIASKMAAGTVNNHKSVAIHPNLMILGSISMFFGSISSFLTFSMALDHSITEKSNISPKYDFFHMGMQARNQPFLLFLLGAPSIRDHGMEECNITNLLLIY